MLSALLLALTSLGAHGDKSTPLAVRGEVTPAEVRLFDAILARNPLECLADIAFADRDACSDEVDGLTREIRSIASCMAGIAPPAPWTGAPDGPWVMHYRDGKKAIEGYIAAGRPHGYWRYWRRDGSPQEEGEYVSGLQQRTWLYWDKDARLFCVQSMKDGQEYGMRTYFHSNGRKKKQGEMQAGKMVGTWVEWDQHGKEVKRWTIEGEKNANSP